MDVHSEVETLLVQALASHHIPLTSQQINAALSDDLSGTQLAQWAAASLTADNLLTVDELALYNSLDHNGQVDRLAEMHDLSQICALREQDVRAAVDYLRRSAELTIKQTETLRHQQNTFSRLVTRRAHQLAKRRQLETAQQRKSESERVRISSEITEIAHGLEFRISELKQDNDPKENSLRHTLGTILQSDDALLANLDKLGLDLSQPDPEEAKSTDKLRETCLRLIKVTVETIRTRLDTTYLSVLAAAHHNRDSDADSDEVDDLQAEVESLYSEILPVAQIAIEKQHLEPALQSIATRSGQALRKTASSLDYIDQCLDYLLSRATTLLSHTQQYHAHSIAVSRVVARAREEMAFQVPDLGPDPAPSIEASTLMKLPLRSKRASRDLLHDRRSSGVHETPALDSLMQSLSLLPIDSYGDGTARSQMAALARLVSERHEKDMRLARAEQHEFEVMTTETLDSAKRAVQLLHDSVFAETPFGPLCLVDPGIEQSIQVLGQEVDKAEDKLQRMRDASTTGWTSLKRDEFIQRWAR